MTPMKPMVVRRWELATVFLLVTLSFVISVVVLTKAIGINHALVVKTSVLAKRTAALQTQQTKEGVARRERIAESDLQLCTRIYGQIVALENDVEAQATVEIYHRLLPSLTQTEIFNLVANARAEAMKIKQKFDPAQCRLLPSQRYAKPKTG